MNENELQWKESCCGSAQSANPRMAEVLVDMGVEMAVASACRGADEKDWSMKSMSTEEKPVWASE